MQKRAKSLKGKGNSKLLSLSLSNCHCHFTDYYMSAALKAIRAKNMVCQLQNLRYFFCLSFIMTQHNFSSFQDSQCDSCLCHVSSYFCLWFLCLKSGSVLVLYYFMMQMRLTVCSYGCKNVLTFTCHLPINKIPQLSS